MGDVAHVRLVAPLRGSGLVAGAATEQAADHDEERTSHLQRGFGSVRVRAHVGSTTWATSVFPDTKRGAYILPVKKDVRRAEGIDDGTEVDVTLELIDV